MGKIKEKVIKEEVIGFAKFQIALYELSIKEAKENNREEWLFGFLQGHKMAWERIIEFLENEEWK